MVPSNDSESALGERFAAIFDSEFSYVCRSLRRFQIRDSDLEDLAHDVFLAAHAAFRGFDSTRPVKPWLFGITFRIASHHKRRAGYQREEADSELDSVDPAPGADVQLEVRDRQRLLIDALGTLDDDRRAVVIMHDVDGIPMQAIATELGFPLFTGYSRLRTGRAELAAYVRRQELRRVSKASSHEGRES